MPHIFKVECYDKCRSAGKARLGDTVYLKSRTDLPMTVTELPHTNKTAGHEHYAKTRWIGTDGEVKEHLFKAIELSL